MDDDAVLKGTSPDDDFNEEDVLGEDDLDEGLDIDLPEGEGESW